MIWNSCGRTGTRWFTWSYFSRKEWRSARTKPTGLLSGIWSLLRKEGIGIYTPFTHINRQHTDTFCWKCRTVGSGWNSKSLNFKCSGNIRSKSPKSSVGRCRQRAFKTEIFLWRRWLFRESIKRSGSFVNFTNGEDRRNKRRNGKDKISLTFW